MADGWDAFAKAAPKAAPAKPATNAWASFPKAAPKAKLKAAAPAPKAAASTPSLWDRAVADVKGIGSAKLFGQLSPLPY